jgi:hypothetical protein
VVSFLSPMHTGVPGARPILLPRERGSARKAGPSLLALRMDPVTVWLPLEGSGPGLAIVPARLGPT